MEFVIINQRIFLIFSAKISTINQHNPYLKAQSASLQFSKSVNLFLWLFTFISVSFFFSKLSISSSRPLLVLEASWLALCKSVSACNYEHNNYIEIDLYVSICIFNTELVIGPCSLIYRCKNTIECCRLFSNTPSGNYFVTA